MILVISTCKLKFSEEEFVKPIISIIEKVGYDYEVVRYNEAFSLQKYSRVIICSTALMDIDYLRHVKNFNVLLQYRGKVLGICAGYQILALLYGNKLDRIQKIGLYKVNVIRENPLVSKGEFYAYFLHTLALRKVNEKLIPLAIQDDEICMFKVRGKEFYGVSFHPEVLNENIVMNFLRY